MMETRQSVIEVDVAATVTGLENLIQALAAGEAFPEARLLQVIQDFIRNGFELRACDKDAIDELIGNLPTHPGLGRDSDETEVPF